MTGTMLTDMNIGDTCTTNSKQVTAEDVDIFCRVTGIIEDIFSSDDAGKAAGLKGKIVPGAQTVSVLLGLLGDITWGLLLVEMAKIQLLAPLYPGDTVIAEIELLGRKMTSKGDREFLTYSWILKNQDGVAVAKGENIECTTKL